MDKIIRVQNELGIGPYQDTFDSPIRRSIRDKHNKSRNIHPIPFEDKGIRRNTTRNEYCGFSSKEQLCRWFTPQELKMLASEDYTVKNVTGNITCVGRCQILFKLIGD